VTPVGRIKVNGGLEAEPKRSPRPAGRGRRPLKLKIFQLLDVQLKLKIRLILRSG